MKTWAKYYHL